MNIREIVDDYLLKNGFDGLFNPECDCGCARDDLMPCSDCTTECEPGYRRPCDCGDHDFHIGIGA